MDRRGAKDRGAVDSQYMAVYFFALFYFIEKSKHFVRMCTAAERKTDIHALVSFMLMLETYKLRIEKMNERETVWETNS